MAVVCVTKTERGTQMAKKRANGEGNIRKRKDGRWEGRYTAGIDPETGKPIAKNVLARTQRECKEKLQKAMEELEKIDITKRRDYTVGEWAQLWYENYAKPSVRASTAAYYKNYIDQHTERLPTPSLRCSIWIMPTALSLTSPATLPTSSKKLSIRHLRGKVKFLTGSKVCEAHKRPIR